MSLQPSDRAKLLDKVASLVSAKHFNPGLHGLNWRSLVESRRDAILSAADDGEFERQVNNLVCQLKTSHTAFVHRSSRRIPARNAINATLMRWTCAGAEHWMFQDVHPGGPAFAGGVLPGDVLLQLGERAIAPPDQPEFAIGESTFLLVRKRDGKTVRVPIQVPDPKSKKAPVSIPQPVLPTKLGDGIAYLKVTMFPGAIGIDVAADIDKAFRSFSDCDRLIIDLRGNTGGGIGGLRLMSYLTPDKLEVGYSLTRKRAEMGYDKHNLVRFGRIPRHKRSLVWLLLRYGPIDHSIAVVTEGLGAQNFHGRVVILVNQHTASAAEMVAAFAQENRLATIVGTRTAGRLLSGKPFKLEFGYVLWLPVAQYLTWAGKLIEGSGVTPDPYSDLSPEGLFEGRDTQLERAVEVLRPCSA